MSIVDSLYFDLTATPVVNDGENISLEVSYYDNGNSTFSKVLTITLNSYGNSAAFTLDGRVFRPDRLRDIADAIEAKENFLMNKGK